MSGRQLLFRDGVSCRNLEQGTEFEVEQDFDSSSDEELFTDTVSATFKEKLAETGTDGTCGDIDISTLSIDELKEKMVPIEEEGMIRKLVIKKGTGLPIPNKAIAIFHYSACIEGLTEPFDSTYLRDMPNKTLIGAGRLILGVDIAISKMQKGEIAKFWIHWELAYGLMGCPPRIPEKSNIICQIEIQNFIDSKEAVEYEELDDDGKRGLPFPKVYKVCKIEHEMGNDFFRSRRHNAAIVRYQKARKMLEEISVSNKAEDDQRHSLLLKLYVNLSVTYFKLLKYRQSISNAKRALQIQPDHVKALYRLGMAFMMEGDGENARHYLMKAKKLKPNDEDINGALLKLEEKNKFWNSWDKNFCKKMFGTNANGESTTAQSNDTEFREVIEDRVKQFISSKETEYVFQTIFIPSQINIISEMARKYNLHFIEKVHDNQKVLKLKKNIEAS